ncbi:MAG TPA: methionyl-tRNA formyltransferase [Gammaproteobacteria bacterium]|nr:methionyl-tRNA formyltransferase [Gammaproteobacteria bacterium]
MRIIYAGTPEFAVPALKSLLASEHEVIAVYTQPDRPAGRGRKLRASPVKQVAVEAGIQVLQPETLRDSSEQDYLRSLNADLMVVAAYGLLLPPAVLSAPRFGCVNIHASLLPRWRGAAPIHRAVLAGDHETGITIMQMAQGLDTGDILLQRALPISETTTTASLHDQLAELGAKALMEALPDIEAGSLQPVPQDDSQACYASKLQKSEAVIDWRQPAVDIERRVRAFNPWPVAQTPTASGVMRIFSATADSAAGDPSVSPGLVIDEDPARGIAVQTGQGVLWMTRIQLPGGKPLDATQFLNGRSLRGEHLGAEDAIPSGSR